MPPPQKFVFEFVDAGAAGGSSQTTPAGAPTAPGGAPGGGGPGGGPSHQQQQVPPNVQNNTQPGSPGPTGGKGGGGSARAAGSNIRSGAAQVASSFGMGGASGLLRAAGPAAAVAAAVVGIGAATSGVARFSPDIAIARAMRSVEFARQDVRDASRHGRVFAEFERNKTELLLSGRNVGRESAGFFADVLNKSDFTKDLSKIGNAVGNIVGAANDSGLADVLGMIGKVNLTHAISWLLDKIPGLTDGRNQAKISDLDNAIMGALLPGVAGFGVDTHVKDFIADNPGSAFERVAPEGGRPDGTELY